MRFITYTANTGGEHGRDGAVHLAEKALLDDRDSHASAADVLLSAAIDDTEVRHVDLAGEEVGAHVSHEEAGLRLREVVPFRTVDRVVGGHVEVSSVVAELQVLVDAAVSFRLGVASGESVTELLSFLVSLVCPNTEEHDVVVFWDAHQFTEVLFRLGEHVFNRL